MAEHDWLTEAFETHRPMLRAVARRVLGSVSEAEDAVQEAWLRLNRSDVDSVENLGGWLTTVVGRICLDMLRARGSRREELLEDAAPPVPAQQVRVEDPEQEAVLVDSVGLALLVVLDTLTPSERLTFVLHDMFAVPFDEIAQIVGGTADAAKMRASRARRRVRTAQPNVHVDRTRQREVVRAFLAASRGGKFDALVALLDPNVVLRSDRPAIRLGAPAEVRGAASVAQEFSGRAQKARLALINGLAGAVWAPTGRPRGAFEFTFSAGKIVAINVIADSDHLDQLQISFIDER